MKEIFVDSHYFLALLNPRDAYHQQALACERPPRTISTRAIQLEVMDALSHPAVREVATKFWSHTENDASLHIVDFTEELLNRAVALFEGRPDKGWSLTDCISFIVMEERGIYEALTGDQHFEQAGFHALLKST